MEIFNMKRNTRGFTLIELLVVIAIIALLMGLLLPALAKALDNARTRKDQGQLKGLVTSFAIFAESDKHERFPIPGMINRLPSDMDGGVFGGSYLGAQGNTDQQGRGPQDTTANLSGWLHSAMIGDNFYDPTILISANENNPMVVAKGDQGSNASELAYDYTMVDPANDTYWDTVFSADIEGEGRAEGDEVTGGVADVCHTSYANLALCGQRLKNVWTNGDHHNIILSSRGPEIAVADDVNNDNFSKSPTLELYGPSKKWEGIFASADGSAHYTKSLWFDEVMYKPQDDLVNVPDNSFQADFADYSNDEGLGNPGGASGDVWMVLNVQSSKTDVLTSSDILYP
jgi:prepilin-type N-terminal cleavage/methylation domain-containing protein